MTYQGVTATFDEDAVVAITGADMSPTHNGDPIDTWTTVAVEAGDELELSFATEGPRLPRRGGRDRRPRSDGEPTYTLVGIGGQDGRTLEDGDELAIGERTEDRRDLVGETVGDEYVRSTRPKTPFASSSD